MRHRDSLDGGSIVQLIRNTESLRNVRVVLCSSMDADELRRLAERLRVEGHVTKSAPLDEVVAVVQAALDVPRAG